jgi:hypothetical protein
VQQQVLAGTAHSVSLMANKVEQKRSIIHMIKRQSLANTAAYFPETDQTLKAAPPTD